MMKNKEGGIRIVDRIVVGVFEHSEFCTTFLLQNPTNEYQLRFGPSLTRLAAAASGL
jgi:hypothetical protein